MRVTFPANTYEDLPEVIGFTFLITHNHQTTFCLRPVQLRQPHPALVVPLTAQAALQDPSLNFLATVRFPKFY